MGQSRDWAGFYRDVADRYGAVDLARGADFGINDWTLRRLASREGWEDPFPGRGVRLHPASAPSYERRVSAGLLALGERALASRTTAAYLHGLVGQPGATVEIVVPHDRCPKPLGAGYRIWRSRTLLAADLTSPRGLRATAIDRTYCDLAAVTTTPRLRALLIDGRQRRLVTIRGVMRRQALMAGTAGLPRLRQAAYEIDASRCDSVLAWYARLVLTRGGLRPDPSEHPVRVPNGVTVHLDVPYIRYRVAVEAEGMGAHSTRRQLDKDVRRRNTLRLIPWRIVWVTWQRLEDDPDGFVEEVREELRRRGWPDEPASNQNREDL